MTSSSILVGTTLMPSLTAFEAVERKGIGHPDSLADMVANEFTRLYGNEGIAEHGIIPNHWVDKINLVGAAAYVTFGEYSINKPIGCYLFGKVTTEIGDKKIDIDAIFRQSIENILTDSLHDTQVLNHLSYVIDNTRGTTIDHEKAYYLPDNLELLKGTHERETLTNDTVICVGYAPLSAAEMLTISIENYLNGPEVTKLYPLKGADIKVLTVRTGGEMDITLCIPLFADKVKSRSEYNDVIAAISDDIRNFAIDQIAQFNSQHIDKPTLHINTKDTATSAYIAPFGTSLGKGDCGAVGRGNRYNGVIPSMRPSSVEAAAGKNPLHHAGKIYTALAHEIATNIHSTLGVENQIIIVARNGQPLHTPAYIHVDVPEMTSLSLQIEIRHVVDSYLVRIPDITRGFLSRSGIQGFINAHQPMLK